MDVELLDGTLDNALDDVVEAEAVHKATDGAGLEVQDAGRVTLCAGNATDSAGGEAKDVTGLALDDAVDNVSSVEALSDTTSSAGLEAEDAGRVTLGASDATNGAGSKAEDITRLALKNVSEDVGNVKAIGGTANSAGAKVEGLVRVARLANNRADGTRAKVQSVARVTLENVSEDVGNVEAIGGTANSAGAKVEGLVGVAGLASNTTDGAGGEVKDISRLTLDNVVENVSNVQAVGQATGSAGLQAESLVRVARLANNRADGARAETEDRARLLALDDVVDGVAEVEAVGKATDETGVKTNSLVSIAAVAAEEGAGGAGSKVQGITRVTLDDVVDNVVDVQAVGEATDETRVKTDGLVSVAAVAAEDRADGTRAKVESGASVALEAKTNAVDGVGDGVEERGDGAADKGKVTLDDGEVEVAKSLVEVDAGEEAVDEGIALDDGKVADSLAKVKATEGVVEEVTLGGNTNVDVADDLLDRVDNAALGDVQATESVDNAVNGLTDAAANNAVDEVAGLDTDLDAVDSVLDSVDGARDTTGKGVLDDAALDIEAEARNNRKAAGDGADVDNVVKAAESLTLGGHGHGGRREGKSDESVLHLEKECVVLTKVGKLVKESVVEKMSCLCVEEGIDLRAGGDHYIYWDEVLARRSHGLQREVIESEHRRPGLGDMDTRALKPMEDCASSQFQS